MSINLFIPAAGYGTRLKPLTDTFPKPLLPVAGVPLIQRIIESIEAQLDIDRIGINTHYLPEKVEKWAGSSRQNEKIELFHEGEILGTGGALVNAETLFNAGTCLLANGDVINDIDWIKLLEFHKGNNNMVTLAVQDREHERRVGADKDNNLLCIDQTCSTPGVDHWFGYACAAVYEPEFLNYLPEGESHVVPYWVEASKDSGRVKVYNIGKETYWLDIGNPNSYTQAVVDSLKGEKRFFAEPLSTPTYTQLDGDVVIEANCSIGENISLENVIILPEAIVSDNETLKNCIVTGNGTVEVEWPKVSTNLPEIKKIGNGGSDRIYSREGERVKLLYSAFEQNIERQIRLTNDLVQKGIKVPSVYSHNPNRREVLLEDLGDQTFKSWLPAKSDSDIDAMISAILSELEKFQFSGVSSSDKVFNYDVLRWETSYFLQRFVKRICGIDEDFSELKDEFHKLAEEVDGLPKVLMHRDFQSENIMIHNGEPWFIDFQTAHSGPPFFDLVSFLRDPYTALPKEIVSKQSEEYLRILGNKFSMNSEQCKRAFILCGLQRHMQALGAYGFLSKIRGKEQFINHVPAALELLAEEVELVKKEFPVLHKLIGKIKESF